MYPFRPNPAAYAECAAFNQKHPIGARVRVKLDDGTVALTTTRSQAWVLAEVCPVILVHGIRGSYLLSRVTRIE